MRAIIGVAMLAACAACATKPIEPVKVLVPVPCIVERPAKPVLPQIADGDGMFDKVKKLLAERELRIAYEGELEAALSACE